MNDILREEFLKLKKRIEEITGVKNILGFRADFDGDKLDGGYWIQKINKTTKYRRIDND